VAELEDILERRPDHPVSLYNPRMRRGARRTSSRSSGAPHARARAEAGSQRSRPERRGSSVTPTPSGLARIGIVGRGSGGCDGRKRAHVRGRRPRRGRSRNAREVTHSGCANGEISVLVLGGLAAPTDQPCGRAGCLASAGTPSSGRSHPVGVEDRVEVP
jgi:hypothetical protein